MLPLNYAILDVFRHSDEPKSVKEVMNELKGQYSHFRAFKESWVSESLMSAEKNGMFDEVSFGFDDDDKFLIYYKANETGKKALDKYLK